MIGHLNIENMTFDHQEFQELDRGFDFYAPQTFIDKDGKRILVGWAYQKVIIRQIVKVGHIV